MVTGGSDNFRSHPCDVRKRHLNSHLLTERDLSGWSERYAEVAPSYPAWR